MLLKYNDWSCKCLVIMIVIKLECVDFIGQYTVLFGSNNKLIVAESGF